MITITFPDGNKKEYKKGTSGLEVAKSISEGLARQTIVMRLDDKVVDLNTPITKDSIISFLKFDDESAKEVFWHSTAHLMAQAILRIFPESKLTIGPPIENGFYYDIDHPPFSTEDLEKIEQEMKKIVKESLEITKESVSIKKAKELFKDNKYKLEILNNLEKFEETQKNSDEVTIYRQGEFFDLCRGPHVQKTSQLKAFKLTKVSGAYWRADAKNKQLQRIYGISFPDKKDLNKYLENLREAEKRDHRVITKKLDLVMLHETSPGNPFFLPKGTVIYNELISFIRDEYKIRGYDEVITPQLFNKKLWETSGHWEHYKEDMFLLDIEGQEFSLKPMNCPSHCLIYKRDTKSYKDLPIRLADFCSLHRNELSGTLSGLTRVRKFSQDDAHIFCTEDQLEQELTDILSFIKYVWEDVFGFKLTYALSTRPEGHIGSPQVWERSENILRLALENNNVPFTIKEGDGAFYGPKIDIDIEDVLGRKWQCPTVQLDFNLPERFDLTYEGSDGSKHRPVMIHRAVFGSLERFFGIMTEHFAGKFPLWLSPEQVRILTIADRHLDYANSLKEELSDFRVTIDSRAETLNKKIREAELSQVNYILVIGDKELEQELVNVRTRGKDVLGNMSRKEFKLRIDKEIKSKK